MSDLSSQVIIEVIPNSLPKEYYRFLPFCLFVRQENGHLPRVVETQKNQFCPLQGMSPLPSPDILKTNNGHPEKKRKEKNQKSKKY